MQLVASLETDIGISSTDSSHNTVRPRQHRTPHVQLLIVLVALLLALAIVMLLSLQ